MRFALLVAFVLSVASLGSTNIQADLNDFKSLLPKVRLGAIYVKHYIFDSNFRTGLKFVKSNEFKDLLNQDFNKSPEVQKIVDYLKSPVSLNFIENSFRSVNVPDEIVEDTIRPRTFVSFVDEVIGLLPMKKVKEMISQKVSSSEEFRHFYARVTDPEFKKLVYNARNAESLKNAIKKMESHNVGVDRILKSAFAVLDKITN